LTVHAWLLVAPAAVAHAVPPTAAVVILYFELCMPAPQVLMGYGKEDCALFKPPAES